MRIIVLIFDPMRVSLICIVACLILSGCLEDSSCGSTNTDAFEVFFFQKSDKSSLTLAFDSVSIKTPVQTIYKEISASELEIPFVPAQNDMYVVFKGESVEDSVRIGYQFIPKLYAPGCDIELVYSDFEILESTFDSLSYINSIPARLEIYL